MIVPCTTLLWVSQRFSGPLRVHLRWLRRSLLKAIRHSTPQWVGGTIDIELCGELTACPSCWKRTNVVPQGLSRPNRNPSGLDVFRISTSKTITYLRRPVPHQEHTLTAIHVKGLSSSPTPNPPDMSNRLYEDAVSTKPNHAFQAIIPFATSLCLSRHGSRTLRLPAPAMASATRSLAIRSIEPASASCTQSSTRLFVSTWCQRQFVCCHSLMAGNDTTTTPLPLVPTSSSTFILIFGDDGSISGQSYSVAPMSTTFPSLCSPAARRRTAPSASCRRTSPSSSHPPRSIRLSSQGHLFILPSLHRGGISGC
jgi:hypothetical protein